jgi:hypothetical protein
MNMNSQLPGVVQDIADVIGRERALFLVGMLPRYVRRDQRGGEQVDLYVPRRLTPEHRLVRILGWDDAERLARAFGGELLKPSICTHLYRAQRDLAILRLAGEGVPKGMLAAWFEVSERHVQNLLAGRVGKVGRAAPAANDDAMEKPQEGRRAA